MGYDIDIPYDLPYYTVYIYIYIYYLVGGLEHVGYLSIQLGTILPFDFHIVQRGWNHQPEFIRMLCMNNMIILTIY